MTNLADNDGNEQSNERGVNNDDGIGVIHGVMAWRR